MVSFPPAEKGADMQIHNDKAVRRDIKFIDDVAVHKKVKASEQCCWNCFWSIMTYEYLWCEREMDEVDLRDLCVDWQGDAVRASA